MREQRAFKERKGAYWRRKKKNTKKQRELQLEGRKHSKERIDNILRREQKNVPWREENIQWMELRTFRAPLC